MINNHKLTFYISLLIILSAIYINSWLPGALFIQGKIIYLILLMTFFDWLLNMNFTEIYNNMSNSLISKDNKYFVILILLFSISIVVYNPQEIKSAFNIVYNLSFVCYIYLYFFRLPNILLTKAGLLNRYLLFTSTVGLIVSFLGIVILMMGISPISIYSSTTHSIVVHPNYVTYLYTISIITTLYYYLRFRSAFSIVVKLFFIMSLTVQLIAQLLTYSRGGYIGTLIGVGILMAFYFRKRTILVFPVVILFIYLMLPKFFEAKGTSSFFSRFFLLIPAYHMIFNNSTNLLWGYGAFSNMKIFVKFMYIYNVTEQGISDPHNSYLRLIMMFGLLFTLLLVVYLIKLLIRCLKMYYTSNDNIDKLFSGYLFSIVFGLITMGLFDSGLVSTVFFYSQFLLISLGLIYQKSRFGSLSGEFI